MKQKYRIADVVIQMVMLVAWLIFVIKDSQFALAMYFITGGWFFISLVIHFLLSIPRHKKDYKLLLIISLVLIGVALIGWVLLPILVLELYALLFGAPIMALLYTYTCMTEIRDTHKRPISLLK